MARIVNQLIGTVASVGKVSDSIVVDYAGSVRIYDGNWRTDENVKFVLTPLAQNLVYQHNPSDTALLAAAIGKQLELAGRFEQDDAPGTTVRANLADNIIVG